MEKAKDIAGNELKVGDEVYYARKRNYKANGELIRVTITKINSISSVSMGKYISRDPTSQLIKVLSDEEMEMIWKYKMLNK